MTATPPRADLRTLAVEALWAASPGASGTGTTYRELAEIVLAAVLPEHRRMVLRAYADEHHHFGGGHGPLWVGPEPVDADAWCSCGAAWVEDDGGCSERAQLLAAAAPPATPSAPAPAGTTPAVPEADGRPAAGGPYRVGRKVGRTIYRMVGNQPSDTDELIGVMDSSALAAFAVRGMNADTEMESERDRLAAQVAQDQPVVEAAKAWRAARPGPWVSGTDVEFHLLAAVDALPDAATDQTEDDRG